jgi:RNA polymerase sigma-70 factor (ECF subfamily)
MLSARWLEVPLGLAPDADSTALERVARGDERAFRELFDHYQPRVFRTAYGILLDASEARDVVQEVFVRLHREAARWRPEGPVAAWLHRTTINQALSARRRLTSFLRTLGAPAQLPAATQDRDLDIARMAGRLRRAMATLGLRERALLTLYLDQDLAPSEMAPILAITANATRVALHRALVRLREQAQMLGLEMPGENPMLDVSREEV